MNNINFIVVSPQPVYVEYIGGITVAHTLANELAKQGENVYLYANSTNSKYNVQCIPWGTAVEFDDDNTIVILISGAGEHTYLPNIPDFLKNAKHVVRWLVNNQLESYPPDNKFYVFHKYWDVIEGQRIDGQLSVIEHDHSLLRDRGWKREGTCYLIKGNLDTESDRIVHSADDFCIDSVLYQIQGNKVEFLADLFNRKELFISYTPFSHASVLAVMCGCKSVVIPKKMYGDIIFDKEKWYTDIWCAKYGIACGMEDLPKKVNEMDKVIPNILHYENVVQYNQINQLIEDSYKWLNLDIKQ